MIARAVERRLEALEQALMPIRYGPAFIMATSRAEAEQAIERLRAEYANDTLEPFVMILAKPKPVAEGA